MPHTTRTIQPGTAESSPVIPDAAPQPPAMTAAERLEGIRSDLAHVADVLEKGKSGAPHPHRRGFRRRREKF